MSVQDINAVDLLKKAIEFSVAGKYADAESLYIQILEHDENNIAAYLNLALLYRNAGQPDAAIFYANSALKIQPDNYEALNLMGEIFSHKGDFEKAKICFCKALEIHPCYVLAIYNYAISGFAAGSYGKTCDFIHRVLLDNKLEPGQAAGLHIILAKIAFLEKQIDKTRHFLDKAFGEENNAINFPGFQNLLTYYNLLHKLLNFRDENSGLYSESTNKIYAIGESNCLSAAYTRLVIDGTDYEVIPKLVIGAQARHLSNSSDNKYKQAFIAAVGSIPPKSKAILVFGEIDCRLHYGILPYHKKTSRPIGPIITEIVDGYINFVTGICRARELDFAIQLVQAPNPQPGVYSAEDVRLLKLVVRQFNQHLITKARDNKIPVIDIYNATLTSEGIANPAKYLDEFHVKPDVLGMCVVAV